MALSESEADKTEDILSTEHLPEAQQGTPSMRGGMRALGAVAAAACAIVISIGSFAAYNIITQRIMRMSLENLTELSKHNEEAMEKILEGKWDELNAIAEHISMQIVPNSEELLMRLSTTRAFFKCIALVLVSDTGATAGTNFVLGKDDALLAACKWGESRFVRLVVSPRATTQGHAIDMVYGVRISPIKVDGIEYTYLVARTDIDSLQDGIKIDCYDGKGKIRIVDTDGSYIVKGDRNRNPQETDNFFDAARMALPSGWTLEKLHDKLDKREAFQTEWRDEKGEKYLASVIPMSATPWFFIMRAPISVFMKQSKSLLSVIMMFMVSSLAVVAAAGFVIFKWTTRMLQIERRHRQTLSHALSLADQASKAKTTFLNNMSHDMRTPMNAIIGYTALALSHLSSKERVKDYLSKISQSSDHLLSLINDVLDMSRIEAGKVNIEEKPESLKDILYHLRNIVLSDIHSKSLDLFIDTVDITDENIICDRLHLTQILLNLMGNAMKFTPAGGTVSLKVTQVKTDDGTKDASNGRSAVYEFRVRDTGIGMSREFVTKVFEPFSRERNTTVSGIEGTGLGLSITRNLVDMMGGTISLKSEKGKGSEFNVTLKFRLHGKESKIEKIPELEDARALVVDDDVESCQGLSLMLRSMGIRSEWTVRGLEAVVRVEEAEKLGDPYKLYLVDWLMPDINGIELARRIRRTSRSPIVMLSAYDWADMEGEARKAGVTDFMSKPLFATDVREVLVRLYAPQKAKSNAPKTNDAEHILSGSNGQEAGAGERLLLVEDNELNREIATEILQGAGFEVDAAPDGTDAVSIMQRAVPGQYAAILMDVQMPEMDGYEATRRIRALDDPLVASVPIIALTANVFEEDKEKAFSAGMDEYMCKPISPNALIKTLQQIVSKPPIHSSN